MILLGLGSGQLIMMCLYFFNTRSLQGFDPRSNSSFMISLLGYVIFSLCLNRGRRQFYFTSLAQVVVPITLWQIVGKIGCFKAGCCYGYCNFITSEFPVQLFEALMFLLIFFGLLFLKSFSIVDERKAYLYLLFYGIERFIAEIFRRDTDITIIGISFYQILSTVFVMFGILSIIFFKQNKIFEATD